MALKITKECPGYMYLLDPEPELIYCQLGPQTSKCVFLVYIDLLKLDCPIDSKGGTSTLLPQKVKDKLKEENNRRSNLTTATN